MSHEIKSTAIQHKNNEHHSEWNPVRVNLGNGTELIIHTFNGVMSPSPYSEAITKRIIEGKLIKPNDQVLDLGTGSGIIGIEAAKMGAHVIGTDIQRESLVVASLNAAVNHVSENFITHMGNMYEGLGQKKFDVVLCNAAQLPTPEPDKASTAYSAGQDGRIMVDSLIDGASSHLNSGGRLIFTNTSLIGIEKTLTKLTKRGFIVENITYMRIPIRPFYPLGYIKTISQTSAEPLYYEEADSTPYEVVAIIEAKKL